MSDDHTPPEEVAEAASSRWTPVATVAPLIGLSERAARDWIKRHDIPRRGERPLLVDEGAVRRKLVELGRQPPEAPPEAPRSHQQPLDADYRVHDASKPPSAPLVPLASVLEQAESWSARYEAMARRTEALALEVGQLRERTARQAGDLDEAVERIKILEAELADARKSPATASTPDEEPSEPQRAGWRRWFRR